MTYSRTSSLVVIDASFAIRAVLPTGTGSELNQFERWRETNTELFAPDLWMAESVSAVRRTVYHRLITPVEGKRAIQDLFALRIQTLASDLTLYLSAYEWAERLGQSSAYDSLYLALAEKLSLETGQPVEVWTADERLANRAGQIGVNWVRYLL